MKKSFYLCLPFLAALFAYSPSRSQTIMPSATTMVDTSCGSTDFSVVIAGCVPGLTLKTWYGDGTDNTSTIFCSGSTGYSWNSHPYSSPGTYTIKHVLYSGTTAIDSIVLTHTHQQCAYLPIRSYLDVNSNCVFDAGDAIMYSSSSVRVDSSGVPMDTIMLSSGNYYKAYGPAGTIYSFRVISSPAGVAAACPTSGIIYDTIPSTPWDTVAVKYFGYQCITATGFDLGINASFTPAIAGGGANKANIHVYNAYCPATAATVKFEFSPKYTFGSILPSTTSYTVSGTSVTIDAGPISIYASKWFTVALTPVMPLTVGDTVNTKFTVNPTTGDANTANNIVVRCDTVRGSYDPNHKSVTPTGPITAGTTLEYMLEFENDGTDTAYNIHILDTLSNHLDISTLKGGISSHSVEIVKFTSSSNNILKFDFPNILLPDTAHHPVTECRGMVTFSIKAKSTLAPGTTIANRVGIYFDTNPAVMTNTVYSNIPLPTSLTDTRLVQVELYPNPVNNMLTVKTDGASYQTATVYNVAGQVISTHNLSKAEMLIPTEHCVPGIYYVLLKGNGGTKALKFEKQ